MLSFASWILPSKANPHRPDKGGFRDPSRHDDDQPDEIDAIDGDDVCGRTVVPGPLCGQAASRLRLAFSLTKRDETALSPRSTPPWDGTCARRPAAGPSERSRARTRAALCPA